MRHPQSSIATRIATVGGQHVSIDTVVTANLRKFRLVPGLHVKNWRRQETS